MIVKKIRCPICQVSFRRTKLEYQCCSFYCENGRKNKALESQQKFIPNFKLSLFRMLSPKCPYCGGEVKPICPNPTCNSVLQWDYVQGTGRIVSILGSKNVGKTTFMTVLKEELKKNARLLSEKQNLFSIVVTKNSEKLENLVNEIYIRHEQFYNTGDKEGPFIFNLHIGKKHAITLLFNDIPGEWYTQEDNPNSKKLDYLLYSDAYILLLDGTLFDNNQTANQEEVSINRFVQLINKRKKPLAIVFNKCDKVNWLEFANYKRQDFNPIKVGGINLKVMLDRSKQIEQHIRDSGFNNLENTFKNNYGGPHAFFDVSTLGNEKEFKNNGPHPWRVLDPLIWILAKLKFPLPIKKW